MQEMEWLSLLFLLHLSTKGFSLNECDRCKCCKGGATRCQHYNGYTDYCLDGCIDGFYSSRCSHACMNNCLNCSVSQICKICSDGYYGMYCSKCPDNCLTCSNGTSCTKCSDGYYGTYCRKCPDNCLTCSDLNMCNECKDGFYTGRLFDNNFYENHSDCSLKCQYNCKSCTSYNTCTKCIDGKYNDAYTDCRESCYSACKACTSYNNCTTCQAGKYGPSCQYNCSLGCEYQECDINNGSCTCIAKFQGDKCDKCANGKYGFSCNSECQKNCEDCTSKTQCTVCKSGHWGETCQLSCPTNCVSYICRKLSGDCDIPCALGYWGTKCNFTCPTNCLAGTCNSTTGVCNDACEINYYGQQCNMTCATTCLPDDEGRRCFYTNGSCIQVCQNGYYGDMCQNRCSENCIINICSRNSGACKFGCVSRFEGKNCTKSNAGVTVDGGNTSDSSNVGTLIGVSVGSVAATLLGVGIVITIRRYLRHRNIRRHAPERTHELTDIQQENISMQGPPNIQPTVGLHVRRAKEELVWLSFLFLLHLSTKGFALNECNRCECCKGGSTRCQRIGSSPPPRYSVKTVVLMFFIVLIVFTPVRTIVYIITCLNFTSCSSCKDGFYNGRLNDNASYPYYSDCRSKCQNNCNLCTSYNNCTACQAGKYGSSCQYYCGTGCQNHECDINNGSCTCTINFQGDKCDKCVNGKYGSSCNRACSYGCANNNCKGNGDCYSCKSDRGFYGPICQECPENCDDCTSKTQCSDCKSGYWGVTCQLFCPSNCVNYICQKQSGDCSLPCALGYWGVQCNLTCPTNCKAGNCNRITGVCNGGCKNNYYGKQCNMTCATTCLPDDEGRMCFHTNGSCIKDCQNGYFGDMCQNHCSENFINIICSRATGECKFGCIGGYEGTDCTKTSSGHAADSTNVGVFIGVSVGSVAATLLAVGIVITIRRYLGHRNLRRHALGPISEQGTHELTDVKQDTVRTIIQDHLNTQPTTDSGYVNTAFPVYEQLKESSKDLNTYGRIDGTN